MTQDSGAEYAQPGPQGRTGELAPSAGATGSEQSGGSWGTSEPPRSERLARRREGRVLGGVASGLGAYFGVDPVVLRLGFAVLTLMGLSGVALYLLLWALLPEQPGGESLAERRLRELAGAPAWVRVSLLVLAGLVALGAVGSATPAAVFVLLAALAVLMTRRASPQA